MALVERAPRPLSLPVGLAGAAAGTAVVTAALTPAPPLAVIALGCCLALVVAAALHPPVAAYALLALTPLTAGIDRGALIPLLRPSEALLALVAAGLVAHWLIAFARGERVRLRLSATDGSVLALAYTGSVLPLLWMVARGRDVSADDLLYASYIWKYAAIYALVRVSVRKEPQVRVCLWVAMAAGAVVAIVAVAQSIGLPAAATVTSWYAPDETTGASRGSSILSSSLAVADVMVFNLAIAASLALRGRRHRAVLVGAALLFTMGVVAASQISGFLALGVAFGVVGLTVGRLRRFLLFAVPIAAGATLLLWPVLGRRLSEFDSIYGLPRAWVGPHGRLENLSTFFWSDLFSDFNWLTGVRVAARVPAPESWREWVWIESGHTWLLWSGGIAFFVACFVFLGLAIRTVAPTARTRSDAVGVAAIATLAALWVHLVVMAIDVHLTLRGSGDLTFALLALALLKPTDPGGTSTISAPAVDTRPPGPSRGAPEGHPWLSILVELEGGRGIRCDPRPGRLVMVWPGQSFAALASTIDLAFARWDLAHDRVFQLTAGRRAGSPHLRFDDVPVVDDRAVEVRGTVAPGDEFTYEFDLEDPWRHRCLVLPPGGVIDPRLLQDEPPAAPLVVWGWGWIPDQHGFGPWKGEAGRSA